MTTGAQEAAGLVCAYHRGLWDAALYLDQHIEQDPLAIRDALLKMAKAKDGLNGAPPRG